MIEDYQNTSGTQTEVKPSQSGITERTLLVDESKAIERVKEWGHVVSPVMIYDRWHKLIPSEVHYWEQNGEYKKILKHARAFNPHEEVQAHLETVIHNLGDQYGLSIRELHRSNNDFNMHLEVLSKKFEAEIKDSFEKDDVIQCGFDLYNGIETSTALGGSMYTMRLNCVNGAVARGKELGTFSIPGVQKASERLARMEVGVIEIFEKFMTIVDYYQNMARIKTNLKKANQFYLATKNRIPVIHMPESFVLDPDYDSKLKRFNEANKNMKLTEILNLGLKGKDSAPIPVLKVEGGTTLWEDFNSITGKINRKHEDVYTTGRFTGREKLNFSSLANLTNHAHRAMFAIVREGGQ